MADLAAALDRAVRPGDRVLDVWSGSRPYDDLVSSAAEVVALDVEGNPYGIADVVSDELLPFPDESFDVVMCIQAFDLVPDPARAAGEFRRVLRPGGRVVVSVPLVWEYDPSGRDRRYTGLQLAGLFAEWSKVTVTENGGRAVAWTTLSGSLFKSVENRLARRRAIGAVVRPVFAGVYAGVNVIGLGLDALERRTADGSHVLPMNLLLTAERPA